MKYNSFVCGKNSKSYKDLNIIENWDDLKQIQPIFNDMEVFVNNISGTNTGKVVARFIDSEWIVPGADVNTIEYINKNRPFNASKTIPKNVEIVGKNLEFHNEPISVYDLTSTAGDSSSACTFVTNIRNFSNKTVKSIKFVIHSTSDNNCTFYGKFKNSKSSINDWKYITWDGVDHITPSFEDQSQYKPKLILSDSIQIPELLPSGESLVVYISCVGSDKLVQLPGRNISFWFPYFYSNENFATDNYSISGSGDIVYRNTNLGNPVSHVVYEFADPTPITSIITIGDSTFSETAPLTMSVGNGWCQHINDMCRLSGFDWRIGNFAQGGYGNPQFVNRLRSLLDSDLKNYIDIMLYQGWSGNSVPNNISEYNQQIDNINTARSLCISAGINFSVLCLYPAVLAEYSTPEVSALREQKLTYYNNMKTYLSANDFNYIDVAYCVSDETGYDYNLEDSLDGSHANIGTYEDQVGQYKQAKALINPINDLLSNLMYR